MSNYLKDPSATVDYSIDWGAGYLGEARTVSVSDWSVSPVEDGGVAVIATLVAPTRTSATLSGGIRGHVYRVSNRVSMSDGRSDERMLVLRMEDR